MGKKIYWSLCLLAVILLAAPAAGFGQAKKPPQTPPPAAPGPKAAKEKIPDPKEVLRRACNFLKKQKEFSFKAEVDNDQVYQGGKKLQFSLEVTAAFQRPDKLRIDGDGDLDSKLLVFDGKTLTLYDKYKNHYATIQVSGDIDAALNKAYKEYGLRVGLAELGSKNLCNRALKDQVHALYAGRHVVRGVSCHHLAFDKKDVHYQVWIATGEQPVLRKIVVTRKNAPGSPQWTAYLSEWNFSPQFASHLFTFTPPAGAQKIKFIPVKKEAIPAPKQGKQKKKGGKS
ncbi:MAG: DUF2092 domain-containing protein [Syntrophales bacterium]|nr:DUF2092 domain-containing protein [Syntrophales bacterium]